jgi:hypothetical protein
MRQRSASRIEVTRRISQIKGTECAQHASITNLGMRAETVQSIFVNRFDRVTPLP